MTRYLGSHWRRGLLMLSFAFACQSNALAHDLVICKTSDSARPVSGTFDFTVTGLSGTISVAAGACSAPIPLPGTQATVRELPRTGTLLTAVTTCIPHPSSQGDAIENCNRLIQSNFVAGSATMRIVGRPTSTTVTFTNEATPYVPPSGYLLTKVSISPAGINDHTQIVGSALSTNQQTHAFLWENGIARDLGTLGGPTSGATAINESGRVVGSSINKAGQLHAFLWVQAGMRDLGTLGDATSVATAINDRDQVVGYSETKDGHTHAFLWQHGEMRDLGTLIGPTGNSRAFDVNNQGQVVGISDTATSPHAFLWEGGNIKDLGALPNAFTAEPSSYANAINDSGVAVGESNGGDDHKSAVWDQSGPHQINIGRATDINNQGQVIGGAIFHVAPFDVLYLWDNGVLTSPFPRSTFDSTPIAINNRGQILVYLQRYGRVVIDFQTSVLLTPLPIAFDDSVTDINDHRLGNGGTGHE